MVAIPKSHGVVVHWEPIPPNDPKWHVTVKNASFRSHVSSPQHLQPLLSGMLQRVHAQLQAICGPPLQGKFTLGLRDGAVSAAGEVTTFGETSQVLLSVYLTEAMIVLNGIGKMYSKTTCQMEIEYELVWG